MPPKTGLPVKAPPIARTLPTKDPHAGFVSSKETCRCRAWSNPPVVENVWVAGLYKSDGRISEIPPQTMTVLSGSKVAVCSVRPVLIAGGGWFVHVPARGPLV